MQIKILSTLLLLSGLFLSGCSTTSAPVTMSDVIIAEPLPVHYRQELHLARLNEILTTAQISNEQRAQLLYERGVLFDELGLKSLARFDFRQAIKLKPDLAEAYNFIGVYLTLTSDFDRAYEAFDSANDLKPAYQFAFFSRGIALYYGDRAKLATADLQQYLAFSPNDPYRIIWQYIVESKYDNELALAHLKENATNSPQDKWPTEVIKLYLGEISERAFLQTLQNNVETDKQLAERLCEAYFYLGKFRSISGDADSADNYYRLALSTNVHGFIEHKYARLELDLK
jgi:lipoprotein NlpI